ncbi:FUSC family protein [Streptomyces thermolineatus]|uniref:FUSC family protein n=2 Tax=Streptomyces thermolineatus TaxID=44033 RepID=A0ABN3M921_9ACTN
MLRMTRRRPVPVWLSHPFRWQRQPVPRAAVLRGALSAGPLLAAGVALGRPAAGVLAALGAMLAGVNDRPGTRRSGVVHIGLPALAGAAGMLAGSVLAVVAPGWWSLPALCVVGLVSGAVSVVGPVSSTAGMQMLVTTVVGAGMPMPGAPWQKAVLFLFGAGWLLALRLLLRPLRPRGGALGGERAAVAAVFDALADALEAVGGPQAEAARRRLTTALDRADEALRLRGVLRRRAGAAERRLVARFAAATALCEASVALLWEAQPLPPRVAEGPRRLASAVRTGLPAGALPAPRPGTPARRAFDTALLEAATVFGRPDAHDTGAHGTGEDVHRLPEGAAAGARRRVLGPAGREYGLRVAVCVAAGAALALALRADHWYWLPATAAFLVKPDMGPLFSRVVTRFAGTALGVLAFTVLIAVPAGPWWPVVLAVAAGALVPVAVRHFAALTAVVTVLVLSFVHIAGDTAVAGLRLVDTALACLIVLLVGHLPRLVDTDARVGARLSVALRRTEAYLRNVLDAPAPDHTAGAGGTAGAGYRERRALRRAAYRALGEARAAAELAAAELPPARARAGGWLAVVASTERIVDAVTACAVRLENGTPRPDPRYAQELGDALAAVAEQVAHRRRGPVSVLPDIAVPPGCDTLADVAGQLGRIRGEAAA